MDYLQDHHVLYSETDTYTKFAVINKKKRIFTGFSERM